MLEEKVVEENHNLVNCYIAIDFRQPYSFQIVSRIRKLGYRVEHHSIHDDVNVHEIAQMTINGTTYHGIEDIERKLAELEKEKSQSNYQEELKRNQEVSERSSDL